MLIFHGASLREYAPTERNERGVALRSGATRSRVAARTQGPQGREEHHWQVKGTKFWVPPTHMDSTRQQVGRLVRPAALVTVKLKISMTTVELGALQPAAGQPKLKGAQHGKPAHWLLVGKLLAGKEGHNSPTVVKLD